MLRLYQVHSTSTFVPPTDRVQISILNACYYRITL